MKSVVTIIAVIVALIGYIPYIRDCIKGKTKPHVISWFIWALVSFLAFGIQFFNEGGAGSFVNLFMGIICSVIFVFSLKNGTKDITKNDWIAFTLALIAIFLWLIVKQPLLSIILVVFIDIMSFLPTIVKAWKKPWTETVVTFGLSGIKNGLSIYALESLSLITVMYPAYSLIVNFFFVIMLVLRRRVSVKIIPDKDFNQWSLINNEYLNSFEAFSLIPEEGNNEGIYIPLGIYWDKELAGELLLRFGKNSQVWIQSWAVLCEYQRKGFGSKLLSKAIKKSKEKKVNIINIQTHRGEGVKKILEDEDSGFQLGEEDADYAYYYRLL